MMMSYGEEQQERMHDRGPKEMEEISIEVDSSSDDNNGNDLEELEEEEESFLPTRFNFSITERSNLIKLLVMITMVVVLFIAELIVGYIGKSLALISDSFHMLSDCISLIVGLVAIIISKKKASATLSYGWGRAELLGGLINGVFLISVVFFIYLEAIQRFFEPTIIEKPLLVLIVGSLGMLVNIIGMIMFYGHTHHHPGHSNHEKEVSKEHLHFHAENDQEHLHTENEHSHEHVKSHRHANFNMLGVFLHVLGDFLGSIGVILTATLLLIFDVNKHKWLLYVDPSVSAFLATIILASSVPLVVNCSKILLQRVPNNIVMKNLKDEIQSVPGVKDVHELHVWQFVNSKVICSVHVKVKPGRDFYSIASDIQSIMHKHGIHSTTIQPEPIYSKNKNYKAQECELICAQECHEDWCCPPDKLPDHTNIDTSHRAQLTLNRVDIE
jgi:zinc transporter 1